MPTNVTAEYKKAEQAFRQARDPHERLVCLKEMLRTLPKHKGTEHLQADIRSRIKGLSEEIEGPKRGGNRAGPLYAIRPEGAAQIGLNFRQRGAALISAWALPVTTGSPYWR